MTMIREKKNGKYFLVTFTSPESRTGPDSAYEMILADTIARYRRISDYAVSFQNTAIKNLNEDRALETLRDFRSRFSISCDAPENPSDYSADTSPSMTKISAVLEKMVEKEDIYRGTDGNYFFRFSRYNHMVKEHMEANPAFIQPASSCGDLLKSVETGSGDIPVSLNAENLPADSSLLRVKLAEDTFVVPWLTRLLCFLAESGYDPSGQPSDRYLSLFPADLLIVKKSDLQEYALYWSAVFLSLCVPLPVCIFGRTQIPASEAGDSFSMDILTAEYGVDAVRYYLLRQVTKDSAAAVSAKQLVHLYRKDLSDLLSALLHTTVVMCNEYFDGTVHAPDDPALSDPDASIEREMASMSTRLRECMEDLRVCDGLAVIFGLYHSLKAYMESTAPWLLAEDAANRGRLEEILYRLLDGIQTASSVVGAFLPDTCDKILEQIHSPEITCDELVHTGNYQSGNKITQTPEPIFPKAE